MGPGAPGFARVLSPEVTGKLVLAHATQPSIDMRHSKRPGRLSSLQPHRLDIHRTRSRIGVDFTSGGTIEDSRSYSKETMP